MTQTTLLDLEKKRFKILIIGTIVSVLTLISSTTISLLNFKSAVGNYVPDSLSNKPNIESNPRFYTQCVNNICSYVVYKSESGEEFKWFYLTKLGDDYSQLKRAIEVSNRLEKYRKEKMIAFKESEINRHKVVCVITGINPDICQIVVTIPSGVDINEVVLLLGCKNKNLSVNACKKTLRI